MSNIDFLNDEIGKPTVLRVESKLSANYLPKNLVHRTEILKTLVRHFDGLFSPKSSSRKIAITGPVGTGKTAIAKAFGLWVQDKGRKENINIKYIHINCRRNRTPFLILLAITRELKSRVPTRGYKADELLEMIIELLEVKQSKMLLVLDVIDYAVDRGSEELLHALTRSSDDKSKSRNRISLILISTNSKYISRLDPKTSSSLSTAIIRLNQYTISELVDIINERVKESFVVNCVSSESIQLTAEIAAVKGDARQALDIMWYAAKFAEKKGNSIVNTEHVRDAKAIMDPSLFPGA